MTFTFKGFNGNKMEEFPRFGVRLFHGDDG